MVKDQVLRFRVSASDKAAFSALCLAAGLDLSEVLGAFVARCVSLGVVATEFKSVATSMPIVATKKGSDGRFVATKVGDEPENVATKPGVVATKSESVATKRVLVGKVVATTETKAERLARGMAILAGVAEPVADQEDGAEVESEESPVVSARPRSYGFDREAIAAKIEARRKAKAKKRR